MSQAESTVQLESAQFKLDEIFPNQIGTTLHRGGAPDLAAAQAAVGDLLQALGYEPNSHPGLIDTPRRVAAAMAGMLRSEPFTLTTFENDGYDEMVLVRDIPFHSLCMHHLLPFTGVAHVAYLPGERIVGLSKLARVVETFARDLQIQERLTTQIASFLREQLQPQGVGVVLEAEHTCMSLRGVQKPGSTTITSSLHGLMRKDPRTREEFLSLIRS